jgi:GTP cyclohydrolase IA
MRVNYKDEWFNEEEKENTPKRIRRFLKELKGNEKFNFTVFPNPGYDQMVILKDIDFYSMCSHHMLPFHGVAHIGYIPSDKICGISKLARVVMKYASNPQIQERMTQEIANFIQEQLSPKGVMVVVEATHLCMCMRGIKRKQSVMITSSLKGAFKEEKVRAEFMGLIK